MKPCRCFAVGALVILICRGLCAGVGAPQIVEQDGRAGAIILGRPLASRVPDRITVELDPARRTVRVITVSVPGMFTQRFITIGRSRLRDVVERYGKASGVRREGTSIVLEYDWKSHLVVFGFDNSPQAQIPPEQRGVVFVSLRAK